MIHQNDTDGQIRQSVALSNPVLATVVGFPDTAIGRSHPHDLRVDRVKSHVFGSSHTPVTVIGIIFGAFMLPDRRVVPVCSTCCFQLSGFQPLVAEFRKRAVGVHAIAPPPLPAQVLQLFIVGTVCGGFRISSEPGVQLPAYFVIIAGSDGYVHIGERLGCRCSCNKKDAKSSKKESDLHRKRKINGQR